MVWGHNWAGAIFYLGTALVSINTVARRLYAGPGRGISVAESTLAPFEIIVLGSRLNGNFEMRVELTLKYPRVDAAVELHQITWYHIKRYNVPREDFARMSKTMEMESLDIHHGKSYHNTHRSTEMWRE